jgi:DNA modification methylase
LPIIKYSSNQGDFIFDPFSGTGTTPAVAKKTGRRWLAIEMVPKWYNTSVNRLENAKTFVNLANHDEFKEKGKQSIFDE